MTLHTAHVHPIAGRAGSSVRTRSRAVRALFVSSEIFPLAKTGGLADVSAALPAALAELGVEPLLMMPGYPQALDAVVGKGAAFELDGGEAHGDVRVVMGRTPDTGLPVCLLDCPELYRRPGGPYQDADGNDWADNAERFGFLCKSVALLAQHWRPDVVHLNDWQTGLAALYLALTQGERPKTLFTVHNMAFQGIFPRERGTELGLPEAALTDDGAEYFGKVSFLKAGLRYADRLTTVSPGYAREIATSEYGFGLEGMVRRRGTDLTGVLNGIDDALWNPADDAFIPHAFSAHDLSGKRACKTALQTEMGLEPGVAAPLFGFLSRLAHQKMVDCVPDAIERIVARGGQFALLGQGDHAYAEGIEALARKYPGRVAVTIGYSEPLAHRICAGADVMLAPARFEPCGLVQMYAMRYGTVPVVRAVGGLADTVVNADRHTIADGTATGFTFQDATTAAFTSAVDGALDLWSQDLSWRRVQANGMRKDFGWRKSAEQYHSLYADLAGFDAGPLPVAATTPALDPMIEERSASARHTRAHADA